MATPQPLIAFLVALNQAYRNLGFYPAGHPGLKGAADRLDNTLGALFADREVWTLGCTREGFSLDVQPLSGGAAEPMKKMAFELFQRRVKELFIHRDVTGEELVQFIGILLVSREELAKNGGAEEFLRARDIAHVRVDSADFTHLAVSSEIQVEGETQPEPPPPPPSPVKEADADPLRKEHNKLLFDLSKQEKDEDYRTLLNKVIHLSHSLREMGVLEPSLQALQMLAMQRVDPNLNEERQSTNDEAVGKIFNEGLLEYLVGRLGKFSEFELEELGRILQSIGHHAVPMLWERFDKLAERPDAKQLPAMTQLIYWLGDTIAPEIESRLAEGKVTGALARLIRMRGEMPPAQHLMKQLTRGEPEARREFRLLLSELGGADNLRLLAQSVNAIPEEDIADLIECIARIDIPQSKKRLSALLGRYMESQPQQSMEIQKAVLRVMEKNVHADYSPALNRYADTLSKVSREKARTMYPRLLAALCAYRDDESLAHLIGALEHDDEEIRQDAWEALAALAPWMDPPNVEETHA